MVAGLDTVQMWATTYANSPTSGYARAGYVTPDCFVQHTEELQMSDQTYRPVLCYYYYFTRPRRYCDSAKSSCQAPIQTDESYTEPKFIKPTHSLLLASAIGLCMFFYACYSHIFFR